MAEGYDFSGLSDLDLVQMQKEVREFGAREDKEFLDAVLEELGKRDREHLGEEALSTDSGTD